MSLTKNWFPSLEINSLLVIIKRAWQDSNPRLTADFLLNRRLSLFLAKKSDSLLLRRKSAVSRGFESCQARFIMTSKLLISREGNQFFVKDISKDYHCQYGFVSTSDLAKKDGSIIKTNTGKELTLFSPSFIDLYTRIKRAPQIITRKDIGMIIAETG